MQISCLKGSRGFGTSGEKKVSRLRPDQVVKKAMTDRFTARIQKLARQDAKRGVYMDSEFHLLQHERMRESVSPDRSGPIAQVTAMLQEAAKEREPLLALLDRLLGNCTGKIQSTPLAQTAEIRSPDGEVIASYNSLGSGWTEIQTKAERKFYSETAMVYYQAFQEARAEMKAAAEAPPPEEPSLDLRA